MSQLDPRCDERDAGYHARVPLGPARQLLRAAELTEIGNRFQIRHAETGGESITDAAVVD
jgi:hypothetical protein